MSDCKKDLGDELNCAENENNGGEETNKEELATANGLQDELDRLREENTRLFAGLQRLHADFDNYRKRVKSERQEWASQALSELILEILPVIDNLERAIEAEGTKDSLLDGVNMVYRQLLNILEKNGLKKIEACGTCFDPNYHHAVMQEECEQEENMVVEELQKGYLFRDRVLRASMVKVAK